MFENLSKFSSESVTHQLSQTIKHEVNRNSLLTRTVYLMCFI